MANNLGIDLEKKFIILKKGDYRGDIYERIFYCEGGFGLHTYTNGNAILGYFVSDGEKSRVEGWQVERLATPEEVEHAKKKHAGVKNEK